MRALLQRLDVAVERLEPSVEGPGVSGEHGLLEIALRLQVLAATQGRQGSVALREGILVEVLCLRVLTLFFEQPVVEVGHERIPGLELADHFIMGIPKLFNYNSEDLRAERLGRI